MSPDATARWTFDGRCEPSDVERVRERSGVCENGRVCAKTRRTLQRHSQSALQASAVAAECHRRGACRDRDRTSIDVSRREAKRSDKFQRTERARGAHDLIDRRVRSIYTNTHDREINAERRHAVRVLLLAQKTDTTHDASSEHTHPHKARFIRHHTPQSHKTVTTYASTYASLKVRSA